MLDLFSGNQTTCEGVSRRGLLQLGSLAGLGLSLPALLRAEKAAANPSKPSKSETNCILIWTQGGTSHHDTVDPKPQAPVSIRGEFDVIDTAVPGVQFTEILPNLAKELGRFAVLRGWNPKNGSHGSADQYVMSGRRFNPALRYPTYGSVVAHQKGFKSALPPFVQLGKSIDRRFGGGTSGILGLEHSPFEMLEDPNGKSFAVRDITPPKGTSSERVDRRRNVLAKLDALQRKADQQPEKFDSLDENFQAAFNMITSPQTKKAFQIGEEDPKLRDRYGRHKFGQSCLLARRLIQSGVRFVTVTDGGWDTHANNFKSLKSSRIPPVDQGLPQLLADLEDQGMLDNTLVMWLTDFGRTPKINSASGRDHWSTSGFAIMAGAGIPGGSVLGATDDEGGKVIRNEYHSEDIAATVYAKLGLPLDLIVNSPDGRPVRLLEGHPIKEFM
jgi:hypothetical protein